MNFDCNPVKIEGKLPLDILGASAFYQCPFKYLDYSGVETQSYFRHSSLVSRALFWYLSQA